ncbi:MAG: hypothetical protein ACLQU1_03095 [Bryobacteraceae bacterium]
MAQRVVSAASALLPALLLFLAVSAQAQIMPAAKFNTAGVLRPGRPAIVTVEKLLDTRLYALGSANDPVDMICCTRGFYLENFGAVFSSELSLVVTPTIMPFRPTISKELHDQVHQRKVERVPKLRAAMIEMMKRAAQDLPQVPENQQIVVAVRLDYLSWEDRTGLPGQITISATRKDALAGVVQTTEEQ